MSNHQNLPWMEANNFVVWDDRFEMDRLRRRLDIQPRELDDAEVVALVDFMHALTGHSARDLPLGIPDTVPSGLPVDK